MATQNPYSDSLLADAFRGSLSNLESLGRGFAVAPVGLLGDVNALAREYITPRLPSSVQGLLQQMPAAPTTERILSNIPRVSAPRMETAGMEQLGAAMNPRGPVDLARGAGRLAGSAVNEAMVYGRGPLAAITPQPMRMVDEAGGLLGKTKPLFDVTKKDASELFGTGAERVMYKDPKSGGVMEVLVKPDGTASVLSLEVPEISRGKGIGESLQAQVMQDYPEMMGQVSSKAAAKTAYRLGRRPPNMPDATLDDVYKLMDENSSVNLVSPKMQNRFIQDSGLLGQSNTNLSDLSYRGSHKAPSPEFGAPLYDLTGGGQMYPADVYSAKAAQYYGTGFPKADKEAFALANKVRGNPDAEVTMYRAVPKDENITNINAGDWVTLSKDYAKTHGESVLGNDYKILSQKVKAKDLWTNADSIHEFGYQPQAIEKPSFTYPQEEAMRLAQQRAALPVEQGGLGLDANNTAEQRAAAMGFDTDLLHGTDQELKKFESKRSISKDHGWYGDEGVYLTPDPNTASGYANWKNVGAGVNGKLGQELYGQNVMPLVVNRGNVFDYGDAPPLMDREKAKEFSETIKRLGFNTIEVPNKYASPEYKNNYETVILNPDDIRSRFAAFDPFRRNAAIAAAMGVAAPNLLAQEQTQSAGLLYPLP